MYFPQFSNNFKTFLERYKNSKMAVIGHTRPDGDCIGSQVALCRVLNQNNIQAICFNKDPIPRVLKEFIQDTPYEKPSTLPPSDFLSITVDCADFKRIGNPFIQHIQSVTANFDHHVTNDAFAEYNFVDSNACATAYILAGLFLDNNIRIDPITAQALYLGICTDTGQFAYPGTTAEVFHICEELVRLGACPAKAATYVFQQETIHKLELTRRFLGSLKLEFNHSICIGLLTQQDFQESGALHEDTEGLVELARSIESVVVGVFLQEQPNGIKGSLRSKDPKFRLDEVAQKFNGGGHHCAAGFFVENINIYDFYPKLVSLLTEQIQKYSHY